MQAYVNAKIDAYAAELREDAQKIVDYYQNNGTQQQIDDAIYLRDTAVDKMVNHYNDQKEKAFNKAETALDKNVSRSYEKANYNEVLAASKKKLRITEF